MSEKTTKKTLGEKEREMQKILNGEKEMQCPECHRGTLARLNDNEKRRLAMTSGDKIEGDWWGCDECKFYTSEYYLDVYV